MYWFLPIPIRRRPITTHDSIKDKRISVVEPLMKGCVVEPLMKGGTPYEGISVVKNTQKSVLSYYKSTPKRVHPPNQGVHIFQLHNHVNDCLHDNSRVISCHGDGHASMTCPLTHSRQL